MHKTLFDRGTCCPFALASSSVKPKSKACFLARWYALLFLAFFSFCACFLFFSSALLVRLLFGFGFTSVGAGMLSLLLALLAASGSSFPSCCRSAAASASATSWPISPFSGDFLFALAFAFPAAFAFAFAFGFARAAFAFAFAALAVLAFAFAFAFGFAFPFAFGFAAFALPLGLEGSALQRAACSAGDITGSASTHLGLSGTSGGSSVCLDVALCCNGCLPDLAGAGAWS